jgi:hypothetical protein
MHRRRIVRLRLLLVLLAALAVPAGGAALWQRAQAPRTDGGSAPRALSPMPSYLGLDAYRHLDKLSYLELGDRVAGQSTADTGGSNNDSRNTVGVLPGGGRILFDATGPGILTFMRMQEAIGAPWRLTVDGGPPLTISPGDLGQLTPAPVLSRGPPYPLSLNVQQSVGSSILAVPLAFTSAMRFASTAANGNYYALYRKLPYGTALPPADPAAAAAVADLLRRSGADLTPPGLLSTGDHVSLAVGAQTTLATLAGPAQIRALTFSAPRDEMVALGDARLRIWWDGEAAPSVDAPLKFLAGDGAGVYQPAGRPLVQGWIAGAGINAGGEMEFHLYWPMPFRSSARIALLPSTPLDNLTWRAACEPFPDPPQDWGTFHATYNDVPHPTPGADMTFLDVTGSGKIVGTVVNFWRVGSTLEGDPRFYIDDSSTPQIAVTGTEEWGLGGDYWHNGQQVSLPLGGLPSSDNNPPGADHDGAALYRFLIADSIPFNRHIVVTWEHGGADETSNPYRAAVLWYGTPVQTALLSDELQPADPASAAAHGYVSPGDHPYSLASGLPYVIHTTLSEARGVQTTGVSTFTLALDPRNVGAFLRRRLDACMPNQRADVYIDSRFAGTWYTSGAPARSGVDGLPRCWRDDDFPLPPALTRGKAAVTVQLRFVATVDPQNTAWSAFRYAMYSFVLLASDPSPGQADTHAGSIELTAPDVWLAAPPTAPACAPPQRHRRVDLNSSRA